MRSSDLLKAALLLWAFGLPAACVQKEKFPTALTTTNQLSTEKKVHDTHENQEPDDLEVFYPTNEWQTLKPGQAVPAGLHIRLNLKTGQREAKLGEEKGAKYWTYGERPEMNKKVASLTAKELKEALKKFKGGTDQMTSGQAEESRISQFYSVDELKRDMETLQFLVETDIQIIRKLLFKFNSTSSTVDQRVTALLELEYLVHQVDNAQNLVSMGGMKLVTDALNSTDVRLQESAAFVLGSAVSRERSIVFTKYPSLNPAICIHLKEEKK